MLAFFGILCVAIALGVGLMVVVQAYRGTTDLLSLRNFFLLGFVLFQLISAAFTFFTGEYDVLDVTDQPRAGTIYFLLTVAFLVIFLGAYAAGRLLRPIAAAFSSDSPTPSATSMLALSAVFLGLGVFGRTALVYVPVLGPAFDTVALGLITVSVGMVAWAWVPRLLNPAVALPALAIIFIAILATLFRSYGRRDIVGLVGAMAWGAYHGYWKHMGFGFTLRRLAILGFMGMLLFGAFTATRSARDFMRSPSEVIKSLTSTNPFSGLYEFSTGQFAAANSMWIIQTRPGIFEYDTLHTMRYVLFHPIPRSVWKNKPGALGIDLPDQAGVRNVAYELNLGPGIVGHIYNDNPWLALVPYAIILALLFRFGDELIRLRPGNPFVILPLSVGVGEIVAMARGEAGLFFVRAVVYTTGAWIAMWLTAKLLGALGWRIRYDAPYADADFGEEGTEQDPDPEDSAAGHYRMTYTDG